MISSFNSMSRLGMQCTDRENPNADTRADWFREVTLSEVETTKVFRNTDRILNTTRDKQVVGNNRNKWRACIVT